MMERETPRAIHCSTSLMILRSAYWLGTDAPVATYPAFKKMRCAIPEKNQLPKELEAFCLSRPEPEEVITFLEGLGLHLDFQMEAFLPPAYSNLAQLPAQFHFEDVSGMSIIYLAGPTNCATRLEGVAVE
jgi:hypothetical protein